MPYKVAPKKRNKENRGLPSRWRRYHGAYYYRVPPGLEHLWDGKTQFRLGSSLSEAYRIWATRLEDEGIELKTINQLLDRYALEVLPQKAAKTQLEQGRSIKKLKSIIGNLSIKTFRPMDAYQYRDKRSKKAPTSANRELEVLSHAFTKAIEWGALEDHPMIGGKFRKQHRPPRKRYVEDWEIVEALSLPSQRKRGSVKMIQAYLKLKLMTGLRRADLLQLQSDNLKESGIHVTPSKTANSSGKSTIYEWNDSLRDVVQEIKSVRPANIEPWLFCNRLGECYVKNDGTTDGWDSMWQRFMDRVVDETKVTDRFWEKDLRAKVASDAESLEHARALLSHATDATTKKVYRRKPERVKPGRLKE